MSIRFSMRLAFAMLHLLCSNVFGIEPIKDGSMNVTLTDELIVKPKDIFIRKMVISPDGNTAYIVGEEYSEQKEEPNPDKPPPMVLTPKGYIIDFKKKSSNEFLNGHKRPITDMARTPDGKQIYTISSTSEAKVRVWDVVNEKSTLHCELEKTDGTESSLLEMAILANRGGVAVLLEKSIAFSSKMNKPAFFDFEGNLFKEAVLCDPRVDSTESILACRTFRDNKLIVWDLKKLEVKTQFQLLPSNMLDAKDNFTIVDMKFANTSKFLFIARSGKENELSLDERAKEDTIEANRRGIWIVDIDAETTKPLGFGTTCQTERLVLDPTDRWMAVLGTSYSNDGTKLNNELLKVKELRIYDMKSKKLVQCRQFKGYLPDHILFSDDGKKLVCADPFGEVRSWSITVTDK